MDAVTTDRSKTAPQRRCLKCGDPSDVVAGERYWPHQWRCRACDWQPPCSQGFTQLAADLDEHDIGMELGAFAQLAEVEPRHFWFNARNDLIVWLVRRFASRATRVIEIGCGTGYVLGALRTALPDAHIAGSELHSRGLSFARSRHGDAIELFQMDARHSGLANAVDLVGAFDVLEHIPEDDAVIAELGTMLRPGGIAIATVPQHPWMWSRSDDLAHHQRRYRVGELSSKFRAGGLEPIYVTSFIALLFPMMMAARLVHRPGSGPKTMAEFMDAEFRIAPVTNGIFRRICNFEHMLRRAGLPLRFGGSQIVVARKPD